MRRVLLPALFFLGLALLGTGLLPVFRGPVHGEEAPAVISTTGTDLPQEGTSLVNGWVVGKHGEADFLEVYTRFQPVLGEPVTGFDGRCQTFRFARLCYLPANEPDWKIQFDNLGTQDLLTEGYTPKPNAQLHPAVRDYLISQLEQGVDTLRVYGRPIFDARCDRRTGECVQWLEKARLSVPIDAVTGDQTRREALGLWLAYPGTRPNPAVVVGPTAPAAPQPHIPLLAAGGLLVVLVGLLMRRPGPGRPPGVL